MEYLSQGFLAWVESFDASVVTTSSAICPSFVQTPDDSSGRTRIFLRPSNLTSSFYNTDMLRLVYG